MRVTFIVLCGIPGSGKSLLAAKIKESTDAPNGLNVVKNGAIHLEFDKILPKSLSFDASNDHSHWKLFRQTVFKCIFQRLIKRPNLDIKLNLIDDPDFRVTAELNLIRENVSNLIGDDFNKDDLYMILDDNMYYQSMREECLRLALRFPKPRLVIIYMDCSLELALVRNSQRPPSEQVPHATIEKMWQTLKREMASCLAGSGLKGSHAASIKMALEKSTCIFKTEESAICSPNYISQLEACMIFIAQAPPLTTIYDLRAIELGQVDRVEQSSRDKGYNLTSILHQSDLVMRKLIGAERNLLKLPMTVEEKESRLKKLTRMGQVKKDVLRDMRTTLSSWEIRQVTTGPKLDEREIWFLGLKMSDTPQSLEDYFYDRCASLN